MLFSKKRKRNHSIFKVPENEPSTTKIPVRLVIGLLAPFIVVAIFLIVFARKVDLTTSVLKPGLPSLQEETITSVPVPTTTPAIKPPEITEIAPPSVPPKPFTPTVIAEVPIDPKPVIKEPISEKKAIPPVVAVKQEAKGISPTVGIAKPEAKTIAPPVKMVLPKIVNQKIMPANTKTPVDVTQTTTATTTLKTPVIVKKPLKEASVRSFTVQVGSFPNREEADLLASRLASHGHGVYVVMADIPNKGTWYRVRVGQYKDRASATTAGEQLAQTEQVAFMVTPDISTTNPIATSTPPVMQNPNP